MAEAVLANFLAFRHLQSGIIIHYFRPWPLIAAALPIPRETCAHGGVSPVSVSGSRPNTSAAMQT